MVKASNIPNRLKNLSKEHPYVAGAVDLYDDDLGKPQSQVNQERIEDIAEETQRAQNAENLLQSEINALEGENFVTVDTYSDLPAEGSVDTIYRVCNWDGSANDGEGAVDGMVYSQYAWDSTNSEYKLLCVRTQIGEVFDISLWNAVGGVLATYTDLADALGTNGANVPAGIRKGGMSVKFVHTSDNKYVQYRYLRTEVTDTYIGNPACWRIIESTNIYSPKATANYNAYVTELYIVDSPSGDFIFKYFGGNIYGYTKSSGVYARVSASGKQDGQVYAVKVYQTNDSTNYPVEKIIAYFVLKNCQTFFTLSDNGEFAIVDRDRAENLHYSPIIADYLLKNDIDGELKELKARSDGYGKDIYGTSFYLDFDNSSFPSSGITDPYMLRSFIKDFKMLVSRDEGYDYGILKVNNGKPSGINYAYCVIVYKWPTGQSPSQSNVTTVGSYTTSSNPQNGLVKTSNNKAQFVLDWSALTEQFGGAGYFEGTGSGLRYNQDYIFSNAKQNGILSDITQLQLDVEELQEEVGDKVDICVPDTIYAVVGDTLQLYYRSIFRCVDCYQYDINVLCDIGSQFPRYYQVTPILSQVGSHNITFKIKNNNNQVIEEKTCSLVVVNAGQSPSANKNVLCVGASATQDGQWASEMKRRLVASGGTPAGSSLSNITFVGRMPVTVGGVQVNLEATGGYQFNSYNSTSTLRFRFNVTAANEPIINVGDVYSNNGNNYEIVEININQGQGGYFSCEGSGNPTASGTLTKVSGTGSETITFSSSSRSGNPFAYDGTIDIQQYADDYCNGQIDVVCTELFGNGMSAYRTDMSTNLASMRTFIDNFLAVFPNCKFFIGLMWNPDLRGGMGVNYGAAGGWSLGYGMKYAFMNMCNALQAYITENNLQDKVFIMNWLNEFDEENDFGQTTKPVNVRSNVTEIFGVNGVHPSTVGYNQMADSAWRLFVAKFCQA